MKTLSVSMSIMLDARRMNMLFNLFALQSACPSEGKTETERELYQSENWVRLRIRFSLRSKITGCGNGYKDKIRKSSI